jgi:hypothetical protein
MDRPFNWTLFMTVSLGCALVLWGFGVLDVFIASHGLPFPTMNDCIGTVYNTYLCGDEATTFCDQYGCANWPPS